MRIIGLISDGRTSHGIYKPILDQLNKNNSFQYRYILTGFHFDKLFGKTVNFVKKEGYNIDYKFSLNINSNNEINQLLVLEYYIFKLRKYLAKTKVDIFLGQGDRIITLAVALVCAYLKIPFAHMHGGEKSTTFDETIRHTITKLSDFHFTASKKSYNRILKMGEIKKRVFLTGSTAAEYTYKLKKKSKKYIFEKYKINNSFEKFCILLFNPDSKRKNKNKQDFKIIINSLIEFGIKTIIVFPNNDPFSLELIKVIKNINNKNFKLIKNFQFDDYLSILSYSKFLIGNSSGGIIETPSLKIPNIIVGNRQNGREIAKNSIFVKINKKDIISNIKKITKLNFFKKNINTLNSPYLPLDHLSPSKKIINILRNIELADIKDKQITY